MNRLLATASLVLLFVAGPALADAPMAVPAKVPFETLPTQHMTILVKVNGKGPYRMIFDTGAPINLVSNKVAREAGLFPKGHKASALALFGNQGQFKINALEVGGVKAERLSAVVMDHPLVGAMAKAVGPIEGIIGFPFFARYKMTLDYQAKEMTFIPSKYEPADMLTKLMTLLMAPKGKAEKIILAPAGQWGFRVAKEAADEDAGVLVQEVLADSPAARAGLKKGDRVLTLAGRWTDTVNDCYAAAAYVPPGTVARLTVKRDGKEMELSVRVQAGL